MWSEEYKDCLEYIDSYWNKITFDPSSMPLRRKILFIPQKYFPFYKKPSNPHVVTIPESYITPNDKKFTYIFYWDSFFMFRGLMGTKRAWLMKAMVNNFMYLFNTYQIIPNFNAPASMGRSQPPFLTSMILDVFTTPHHHKRVRDNVARIIPYAHTYQQKKWFEKAMEVAKKEYLLVWLDVESSYNHRVEGYKLSRYGDRDIGYAHSSELESGWDMTSRYYNRCDQFLPIDLNSYLYKYEIDFARAALMLGKEEDRKFWEKQSKERKEEINKYMWNDDEGFFFDYGHTYQKISHFFSLASFTPLWSGIATPAQAERMLKHLHRFETPYGLTITDKASLAKPIDLTLIQKRYHPAIKEIIEPKQWDYPNIWSPLEYQTVIGLLRYGYVEDARRIMEKSVKAHAAVYRKYGTFLEKLNGVTGERPPDYHYPSQPGFGWTNAVFYRYIQILESLDKNDPLYVAPKPKQAPFDLAILH